MVIIFGTGQLAEVAFQYLTRDTAHQIVAFTVDQEYMTSTTFMGLPVVPFESVESVYPSDQVKMFIPISYYKLNQLREKKYLEAKAKGYSFISYIHSSCLQYQEAVGENCFILDKNTLQPGVTIGNNVILWSGNHIGHHSHIDDHTFIASHVVISGSVQVGKNCFFGVNATIGDNLKIGNFTVVGAGAMVLKGVGDHSLIVRKSEALSERSSHRLRGL